MYLYDLQLLNYLYCTHIPLSCAKLLKNTYNTEIQISVLYLDFTRAFHFLRIRYLWIDSDKYSKVSQNQEAPVDIKVAIF